MIHDHVQLKEVTTNTLQISEFIHVQIREITSGKQFNGTYWHLLEQKLLEISVVN